MKTVFYIFEPLLIHKINLIKKVKMRAKTLCMILIFLLSGWNFIFAQGVQPPSKGKAVVYFVPANSGPDFEYFHQDKYIGAFKANSYLRYECDPGKQLFWASSENKYFLTTELKEDGIYIVMVYATIGGWKSHVQLVPLMIKNNQKDFEWAKNLINKKRPIRISEKKITKMNRKLKDFISLKLNMCNEKWKNEKYFNNMTADMAIPAEAFK